MKKIPASDLALSVLLGLHLKFIFGFGDWNNWVGKEYLTLPRIDKNDFSDAGDNLDMGSTLAVHHWQSFYFLT